MPPVISVVIPTYKRPEKLRRALESIAGALESSYEVIVVDDCADASARMVAYDYGAIYINKGGVNRGQAFSRNTGLEMARGSWVVFLDDDDFFLFGGLSQLLKGAAGSDAAVIFGDYQTFNYQSRCEVILANVDWDILRVCNQVPMGAFLIARHAVKRNFDTRMRSHEDWDFLLSNIALGGMAHVPGGVVAIDKTENMTTSTEARRRQFFWLDFLSIYARFPAAHLGPAREAMLASLGLQLPPGILAIDDVI